MVAVVLISYCLVLVFHHPCIFCCCCKFTFPLVNFHLCICQMKKKYSRAYAIVCIRMLSKRCNVLLYHICRPSPTFPISRLHPKSESREKYINELTSEKSLKLDWIDENSGWYIFGMISEKIRLTHVRLFGASLCVSASDSSSSSTSLSLNVLCCCGIFVSLV